MDEWMDGRLKFHRSPRNSIEMADSKTSVCPSCGHAELEQRKHGVECRWCGYRWSDNLEDYTPQMTFRDSLRQTFPKRFLLNTGALTRLIFRTAFEHRHDPDRIDTGSGPLNLLLAPQDLHEILVETPEKAFKALITDTDSQENWRLAAERLLLTAGHLTPFLLAEATGRSRRMAQRMITRWMDLGYLSLQERAGIGDTNFFVKANDRTILDFKINLNKMVSESRFRLIHHKFVINIPNALGFEVSFYPDLKVKRLEAPPSDYKAGNKDLKYELFDNEP
jgi:ribosomal protein L37AE/L43A